MTGTEDVRTIEPTTLVCKRHPNVETLLRCNQCDEPICLKCAVRTPVGYRCRDCIRAQQDRAYNMAPQDPWLVLGLSLGLALIAAPVFNGLLALLARMLPFYFLLMAALLAGIGAGRGLVQLIRRAVQRRRGRFLGLFALIGVILGSVIGAVLGVAIIPVPPFGLPLLLFVALTLITAWPVLR